MTKILWVLVPVVLAASGVHAQPAVDSSLEMHAMDYGVGKNPTLWQAELDRLNGLLAEDPQNVELLNQRADVHTMMGNLQSAIVDYTQAIALKPDDAVLYGNRGNAYLMNRELDLAIADLEQSVAQSPDKIFYGNLGNAYLFKKDYENAIEAFGAMIDIDQTIYQGYANRAAAYVQIKKLDEALADLNRALELEPDFGYGYANRANVHYMKGMYPQSLADFKKARDLGVPVDDKLIDDLEAALAKQAAQ